MTHSSMYLCVEKEVKKSSGKQKHLWSLAAFSCLSFFQEGKLEKNNSKGET